MHACCIITICKEYHWARMLEFHGRGWHIRLTFSVIVVEPTPNSTCFDAHAEAPLPQPHPRGVHGGTSESFFEHPIWVFCKTIPAPRQSMTNVVRGLPIHTMQENKSQKQTQTGLASASRGYDSLLSEIFPFRTHARTYYKIIGGFYDRNLTEFC